jgi:hypothetical protein
LPDVTSQSEATNFLNVANQKLADVTSQSEADNLYNGLIPIGMM